MHFVFIVWTPPPPFYVATQLLVMLNLQHLFYVPTCSGIMLNVNIQHLSYIEIPSHIIFYKMGKKVFAQEIYMEANEHEHHSKWICGEIKKIFGHLHMFNIKIHVANIPFYNFKDFFLRNTSLNLSVRNISTFFCDHREVYSPWPSFTGVLSCL